MALRLALLAVLAFSFGWVALQVRRRRAGLCPQCGRRLPDAEFEDSYGTAVCSSCVEAQKCGSRVALYVFSGFAVLLAGIAGAGIAEDVRRGYKYGLKDVPETAVALVLLLAPAIALVLLSWRHLKAAETAHVETNDESERAAPPGGPTRR